VTMILKSLALEVAFLSMVLYTKHLVQESDNKMDVWNINIGIFLMLQVFCSSIQNFLLNLVRMYFDCWMFNKPKSISYFAWEDTIWTLIWYDAMTWTFSCVWMFILCAINVFSWIIFIERKGGKFMILNLK